MASKIITKLRESEARRWDGAKDPLDLLEELAQVQGYARPATARKLQLFTSAVCRTIWGRLAREERTTVELVEAFTDADKGDHKMAQDSIGHIGGDAYTRLHPTAALVHWMFPMFAINDMRYVLPTFVTNATKHGISRKDQANTLRGLLGNPHRPPRIRWKGATVENMKDGGCVFPTHLLNMARHCYEDRLEDGSLDRARLWVLSDALEDEGMEGDLLGSLREEVVAWRGWWSLDYVLGKD